MVEKGKIIDDIEIRIWGIEALNKVLGPVAALRFLLYKKERNYVLKKCYFLFLPTREYQKNR